MSIFTEMYSSFNEVYFGKTPSILAIERKLSKFRQKYMGIYVINTRMNCDPDLLELNRMIEEQFGFGCFSLMVINMPQVNAFTLPVTYKYDYTNRGNETIADKNTWRYKPGTNYACITFIFSGLIFNPKYTDEEIMACILHEIGHNFFAELSSSNASLSGMFMSIKAVLMIISVISSGGAGLVNVLTDTNAFQRTIMNIDKAFTKNSELYRAFKGVCGVISGIQGTIAGGIYQLIDLATMGISNWYGAFFKVVNAIGNPLNLFLISPIRYRDERSADNFATMYGYGSAVSSLVEKLGSIECDPSTIMKVYNKIPLLSNLYNMSKDSAGVIIQAFDEHPNAISRMNDQLSMLQYEANKSGLDPKMKAVILNDAKDIQEQIDKYKYMNTTITDKEYVKNIYFRYIANLPGCKGFADCLNGDDAEFRFADYDREYRRKRK